MRVKTFRSSLNGTNMPQPKTLLKRRIDFLPLLWMRLLAIQSRQAEIVCSIDLFSSVVVQSFCSPCPKHDPNPSFSIWFIHFSYLITNECCDSKLHFMNKTAIATFHKISVMIRINPFWPSSSMRCMILKPLWRIPGFRISHFYLVKNFTNGTI